MENDAEDDFWTGWAETGVREWGILPTERIPFSEEVRRYCQNGGCGHYGRSWACPPAVGEEEVCRARCLSYDRILVFNAVYPLEDSFDFEGMKRGMLAFKEVCDRVYERAREKLPDFLLLSNEGCFRCPECTFPDRPCRIPDKLFPSIEGYGIWVSELAARAGLTYCRPQTVTYFGGLLFCPDPPAQQRGPDPGDRKSRTQTRKADKTRKEDRT